MSGEVFPHPKEVSPAITHPGCLILTGLDHPRPWNVVVTARAFESPGGTEAPHGAIES
jgi:hypothetical protein